MSATATSKGHSTAHDSRPLTIHKDGYSAEIVREMTLGKESYRYFIRRDGGEEVIAQGLEASALDVVDHMNKEELDPGLTNPEPVPKPV